jgi:hypothetical protein
MPYFISAWLIIQNQLLFFDVMRLLSTGYLTPFTKEITQVLIIAVSVILITSSMMLFITDRGNIISYTLEHIQDWKNPTYEEMQDFISSDDTDLHVFIKGNYECKQYCFDIIRNAREHGYRAGYVTLSNPLGDDHAIICFDTTDKGLFFVEPQLDVVFTALDMQDMLDEGIYSLPIKGLPWESAMSLDNVHISWYMVI